MARTSKKHLALRAALEIIEAERSTDALTYDSLASATGMSKSGLIYHFPTRHDLLVEIHRWCARRWEEQLLASAGIDLALSAGIDIQKASEAAFKAAVETALADVSELEKGKAALKNLSFSEPLVELLMNIHASSHPDFLAPWAAIEKRWFPDPAAEIVISNQSSESQGPGFAQAAAEAAEKLGRKLGGLKLGKIQIPEVLTKPGAQAGAKANKADKTPISADKAQLLPLLYAVIGNGLWVFDHVNPTALSEENRQKIVEFALSLQAEE